MCSYANSNIEIHYLNFSSRNMVLILDWWVFTKFCYFQGHRSKVTGSNFFALVILYFLNLVSWWMFHFYSHMYATILFSSLDPEGHVTCYHHFPFHHCHGTLSCCFLKLLGQMKSTFGKKFLWWTSSELVILVLIQNLTLSSEPKLQFHWLSYKALLFKNWKVV